MEFKPTTLDMEPAETPGKHISLLIDLLEAQVQEHNIQSVLQWQQTISLKDKLQILVDYGLQYRKFLKKVIKQYNREINEEIKAKTLAAIFEQHVDENWNEIFENIDDILQGIVWLDNLFAANEIEIIEFFAWNEIIKSKRYPKINGLCLQGDVNAGKSLLINGITTLLKSEPPIARNRGVFRLGELLHATSAVFEEPYITPTNVGTWKLILEGSTVKPDKKHADKQNINRIPIYITTVLPIDNNVQQSEKEQIAQQLKTFIFKRTIWHSEETAVRRGHVAAEYIKPPVFITPLHFAILFTLYYPHIFAFIQREDTQHPALNSERLQLLDPESQHLKNTRNSLRTVLDA